MVFWGGCANDGEGGGFSLFGEIETRKDGKAWVRTVVGDADINSTDIFGLLRYSMSIFPVSMRGGRELMSVWSIQNSRSTDNVVML